MKRFYGALLTLLGIGGLAYAVSLFMHKGENVHDINSILICAFLGLMFFLAGIAPENRTKNRHRYPD
jgi:hypothetical protein